MYPIATWFVIRNVSPRPFFVFLFGRERSLCCGASIDTHALCIHTHIHIHIYTWGESQAGDEQRCTRAFKHASSCSCTYIYTRVSVWNVHVDSVHAHAEEMTLKRTQSPITDVTTSHVYNLDVYKMHRRNGKCSLVLHSRGREKNSNTRAMHLRSLINHRLDFTRQFHGWISPCKSSNEGPVSLVNRTFIYLFFFPRPCVRFDVCSRDRSKQGGS